MNFVSIQQYTRPSYLKRFYLAHSLCIGKNHIISFLNTYHIQKSEVSFWKKISWFPNNCPYNIDLLTSCSCLLIQKQNDNIFQHVFEFIIGLKKFVRLCKTWIHAYHLSSVGVSFLSFFSLFHFFVVFCVIFFSFLVCRLLFIVLLNMLNGEDLKSLIDLCLINLCLSK